MSVNSIECENLFPGLEVWHQNVLLNLALALKQNHEELILACRSRPFTHVAWLVRNLVELKIWAEYCTKSTDNARVFFFDCLRDMKELYEGVSVLLQDLPPEERCLLDNSIKELHDFANTHGVDVDDPYKAVRAAAEALGADRAMEFRSANKVISKYAHPTALAVMMVDSHRYEDCEARAELRKSGDEILYEALTYILGFFKAMGFSKQIEDAFKLLNIPVLNVEQVSQK